MTLSAHCHDDLGMAVANSLAAVQAGARQVECTINGIGERAGNASLEEIVMALHVRRDRLPFDTAIRSTELCATSRLLSETVDVPVPPNKAIVGANAFAHEAGIHQDGVLKNPLTYEILRPEDVGAPGTRLVLGKHSGTRGVDARCRALGFYLRPEALARVYARLVTTADTVKTIEDFHIVQAVDRRSGGGAGAPAVRLKIALLPGDGIGPEVIGQAVRVLELVADAFGHDFETRELLDRRRGAAKPRRRAAAGHARRLSRADAVLLGAVGDPAFDHLEPGQASRSGAAGTARGARRIRQPAAGADRSGADWRDAVSPGARGRRRRPDRARAARRPVLRRSRAA